MAALRHRDGTLLPQLAPFAIQGARHAARQVGCSLEGRPTTAFRYRNKGIMATIGRNAAVAELPGGLRFRGSVAWLVWLGLHLIQLVGFRNRAQVLLDWGWTYVTYDRSPRLIFAAFGGPSGRPRGAAPREPSGPVGSEA